MSEKIKMEIERDLLLKLKSTNYEAYQLLNSLKLVEDLDYDYCQTLDIEKLKKECELGYFNVMDLFPKEKIVSAYLEYVNPISRMVKFSDLIEADRHLMNGGKSVSIGYKIDEAKRGGIGLEQGAKPIITQFVPPKDNDYYMKPVSDFVQTDYVKKDPPKKHQALKDFLEDNHNKKAVRIKVFNQDMFIRAQEVLFGFGCEWAGENPSDYKENIFIGLYRFAKEIRYCDNSDLCFVKSEEFIDYCFKTEKFI